MVLRLAISNFATGIIPLLVFELERRKFAPANGTRRSVIPQRREERRQVESRARMKRQHQVSRELSPRGTRKPRKMRSGVGAELTRDVQTTAQREQGPPQEMTSGADVESVIGSP
ncbi:hypothetical protein AAFF_G00434000 [Aldrovandia affinis]|uniref:Uncharacterized protein n=1 Tax=Aldrovandia affinis TaxID=143900 RepID=A0AAD7S816_9TELE|nr:hypothetical protein AAFF_G00434000 [Aldrovandia affinis]